jgi:dephospho-CoA kinase
MSILSELGWSVISADTVGHEVLSDPSVLAAVAARWPSAVTDGQVSRPALAGIVFREREEISALERITHPVIVGRIDRWVDSSSEPGAIEVSVLKVARPQWGPLVIVHAARDVRRERALKRGMAETDLEARMTLQPSDSEMLAAAQIVIDNNGTVDELSDSLRKFDEWIRSEEEHQG